MNSKTNINELLVDFCKIKIDNYKQIAVYLEIIDETRYYTGIVLHLHATLQISDKNIEPNF